ncbi:MAG: Ribonuclease [Actinomycetia bacterium]|nr:Ribonuclease [Actinomycetes bacterium]
MAPTTTVFTDGACSGNPGPGGWAWAVPEGPFASGFAEHTTNQRMELTAALEAVRTLEGPLEVVSDSTYVVNCFKQGWYKGWLARGWLNSQKKPVANRDLWEPLIELVLGRDDVTFRWVKGHSGDPMNDLVDGLAVEAILQKGSRTGAHASEALIATLPKDDAGRIVPGAQPSPVSVEEARDGLGFGVAVTGPRPPGLGGYGDNPIADRVRARLTEIFAAKLVVHPDLVVLTGLMLGTEQLAAEAAAAAGVPYVAVLPYPEPESVWPRASQDRFRSLLAAARAEVLVQVKPPTGKQQAGAAMVRRDAWLGAHAREAVAVWDGSDPNLGRLVKAWEAVLDDVWVLNPGDD